MVLDPKIAKVEIRGVSGVNLVTLEELGIGDGGGGVDPSDIKITVDKIEDASAISKSILKESSAINILTLINASPANHNHTSATNTVAGFMSTTDKVKLDGIAVGATVNSSNATLLNRANHTGTQDVSSISGVVPINQLPYGTSSSQVALGNHSHPLASSVAGGMMSYADKNKLDSITASSVNPIVASTANIGTSTAYARADHVHPVQTNVNVASMLMTGRTFTLTGGATGVGNNSFNGTQNIIIDVSITPATTTTIGGVLKAVGVEDTTGEDLQALKTTLNELLANLREAGIMY